MIKMKELKDKYKSKYSFIVKFHFNFEFFYHLKKNLD